MTAPVPTYLTAQRRVQWDPVERRVVKDALKQEALLATLRSSFAWAPSATMTQDSWRTRPEGLPEVLHSMDETRRRDAARKVVETRVEAARALHYKIAHSKPKQHPRDWNKSQKVRTDGCPPLTHIASSKVRCDIVLPSHCGAIRHTHTHRAAVYAGADLAPVSYPWSILGLPQVSHYLNETLWRHPDGEPNAPPDVKFRPRFAPLPGQPAWVPCEEFPQACASEVPVQGVARPIWRGFDTPTNASASYAMRRTQGSTLGGVSLGSPSGPGSLLSGSVGGDGGGVASLGRGGSSAGHGNMRGSGDGGGVHGSSGSLASSVKNYRKFKATASFKELVRPTVARAVQRIGLELSQIPDAGTTRSMQNYRESVARDNAEMERVWAAVKPKRRPRPTLRAVAQHIIALNRWNRAAGVAVAPGGLLEADDDDDATYDDILRSLR